MKEKLEKQYWLHRILGGVNGRLLSYPLLCNHYLLSIGWGEISSDLAAKDIQQRGKIAIQEIYEKQGIKWSKNAFSLIRFVHEMRKGDIVIVPMGPYISIYRIADDVILTNDSISTKYLEGTDIVKKTDGLATLDGQYIDLGFYRKVEPIMLNISRSQLDIILYRKTRILQTNINISSISFSIEKLLTTTTGNNTQVFGHDRRLIEFNIQNYKNINHLQLSGLKRLNLFVGANNAGKSNLLEAISLYASNFNHKHMIDILHNRNENIEYFEEGVFFEEKELLMAFAPFFPQRSVDRMASGMCIRLSTPTNGVQLVLKTAIFRDDIGVRRLARLSPYGKVTQNQKLSNLRETVLVTLPIEDNSITTLTQTKNFENVLQMTRFSSRGIELQTSSAENQFNFQHLNCKHLQSKNTAEIWAKIAMTEKENIILEALRIADERVKRFNFVKINTHTYLPMVLLEGTEDKMPLSEMGDGMTHILNIIMAMLACKDGILLLDEVESGLHYTTQFKLWKMIFTLAEKYNVQVFATTHSEDCIKAFVIGNQDNDNALLVRMSNNEGCIYPTYYRNMYEVQYALINGIEGR